MATSPHLGTYDIKEKKKKGVVILTHPFWMREGDLGGTKLK